MPGMGDTAAAAGPGGCPFPQGGERRGRHPMRHLLRAKFSKAYRCKASDAEPVILKHHRLC